MLNLEMIPQRDAGDPSNKEPFQNDPVLTVVNASGHMRLNTKALQELGIGWSEDSVNIVALVRGYGLSDDSNPTIVIGATDMNVLRNTKLDGSYNSAVVHQFSGGFRSQKMLEMLAEHFGIDDEIGMPNTRHFLLIPISGGVCSLTVIDTRSADEIVEDISNMEMPLTNSSSLIV